MTLQIEKRTRALNTDPWGNWVLTSDVPPYTDTDLVEYRIQNTTNVNVADLQSIVDSALSEVTQIDVTDITSNTQLVQDGTNLWKVTGDGHFDKIMESVNLQLKAQFDSDRITGSEFARAYVALFQSTLAQSNQFVLGQRARELATDGGALDVAKKALELGVLEATQQTKIDQAVAQLEKLEAETDYVKQQDKQLVASVGYNNKIKALDALGDTYGTFGAGGITVNADMWTTYFTIVTELTAIVTPPVDPSTIDKVT